MMSEAMNVDENTSPQKILEEEQRLKESLKNTSTDQSDFLYPTLILVPLVIVFIGILTLKITTMLKLVLLLFVIISIVFYILQYRKYNISDSLVKMTDKVKKVTNTKNLPRTDTSLNFNS